MKDITKIKHKVGDKVRLILIDNQEYVGRIAEIDSWYLRLYFDNSPENGLLKDSEVKFQNYEIHKVMGWVE